MDGLQNLLETSLERMDVLFQEYDIKIKEVNDAFVEIEDLKTFTKDGGDLVEGLSNHVIQMNNSMLLPKLNERFTL